MKTTVIIAFVSQAIPAVLAFCCRGDGSGYCKDGTESTPCCATQSCNIFCCACGGSCRSSSASKLLIERDPAEEAFALADSAGTGELTLDQYLGFMGVDGQPQIWTDWFEQHDRNGDGVITEDEIQDV